MASASVVGGMIGFIQQMAAGENPVPSFVFLSEAPMRTFDGNGAEVVVTAPYIEVEDMSGGMQYKFEAAPIESPDIMVRVIANSLVECESIVMWIRFGGVSPGLRQGLDLTNHLPTVGMVGAIPRLKSSPRFFTEQGRGKDAKLAYCCELTYSFAAIGRM
jgi:hypothetical protein